MCISIPDRGHPDELWSSEMAPSEERRREERTKREMVYADGSLRANARYPGHVRSANRTYCRAHDSPGHFNISAECAEKTVERGQLGDEKTKGEEKKAEGRKEREKRKTERRKEREREREKGKEVDAQTRGEELLRDTATGLAFSTP